MVTWNTEQCQAFVDETNAAYAKVHEDFEEQFWGTKMNMTGVPIGTSSKKSKKAHYSTELLSSTKKTMEDFLRSPERLAKTKEWLEALDQAEEVDKDTATRLRKVLSLFKRTFLCYIMESKEALQLREESTAVENTLNDRRNAMSSGITIDGNFTALSSVGLRNKMRTDPSEDVRKACYTSLDSIGDFICDNGFIEVVKKRNEMAKKLGYEDFYEYKVQTTEGFGKARLFKILDSLEEGTKTLMESSRVRLAAEHGDGALHPWNMGFKMSGDVTAKLDPYFPFTGAVEAWGRSYNALGIKYRGATMDLDLLDRKGKYSNGFCHWPVCAWTKPDGTFQPSTAHFTSLADPKAVGSGLTALTTLMHEAGHAAHFANICQPSPLFAQERAPTSVAYAETQSMFLDSLVSDSAWRAKYARNRQGERIPWDLLAEDIKATHPYAVFSLRSMLSVPYFEKALYEMPADDLSKESIIALAVSVETKIQGGRASRPLLSVPHIISDEASCYYHGYVLAEMAVWQTREWFLKKHGYIVDNPIVGPTLTKAYWECGNAENFLDLVSGLTGRELDGASWTNHLQKDLGSLLLSEQAEYNKAIAEPIDTTSDIDLHMTVRFVDGDNVIADTSECGGLKAACAKFAEFIESR